MNLSILKKAFRWSASLKVAIPLLVLLIGVTILGSLFPTPEVFRTAAYLGLLGVLGISLLFVTILHAPQILKRRGRHALIGVIVTHVGILVLIAGIIYGSYAGVRHEVKLVEGEVTVVPGLPFAIQLDRIEVEQYRPEDFPAMNLDALPKKRQDSRVTLLKNGEAWLELVAAPGSPARVEGITLLPSVSGIGWVFELVATDADGGETNIPVRPWAPPLIDLGKRQVMTHALSADDGHAVEILAQEDGRMESLGHVRRGEPMRIDAYELSLGAARRYTGMQVYTRPQESVLVLGSLMMFAGLVWHFYFRHRDRRREGRADG